MDGHLLVRFLSDQQDCLHWFLRLRPTEGDHDIVVSSFHFCEDRSDVSPDDLAEVAPEVEVCADSFAEFIWRFWIENEIYFVLSDGRALSDEQQAYVDHYTIQSRT